MQLSITIDGNHVLLRLLTFNTVTFTFHTNELVNTDRSIEEIKVSV